MTFSKYKEEPSCFILVDWVIVIMIFIIILLLFLLLLLLLLFAVTYLALYRVQLNSCDPYYLFSNIPFSGLIPFSVVIFIIGLVAHLLVLLFRQPFC